MSFLKRIGSTRKKNSYRLAGQTERPFSQSVSESAAQKLAGGLIQCHITLLDDSMFTCDLNKHSLGSTLLDEVYSHTDIVERDYFGLGFNENGYNKWLESDKPLKKQFKGGSRSIVMELKIKFYTSDPSFLLEEITRYLFFLQVKKDLLEGRLPCPPEAAAILGAFALQAELGDFDPVGNQPGYVSEFKFIPSQNEAFEDRVAELHQGIRGQSNLEAEYNFLQYARQLEFYGVELYPAADDRGVPISLGVCSHGLVVFRDMIKLHTFPWSQVLKITYSRKKFYVELRKPPDADDYEKVVGFHMDNNESSKRLWVSCIEHHAFFRMTEVSNTPQRGSPFRKSKVKITRRTERQVVEASKSIAREGHKIRRTPSKRYPRRPRILDGEDILRRRANTEIRRTGSLRDYKPTVEYRRGQSPSDMTPTRRMSATRDLTPTLSSPRSPSLLDDDYPGMIDIDITGQFQIGETEESGFTTLQFSDRHHHDKEVGEYYDELNAAEELAGQMTVDDLASEGYLLVRLNPDPEKRFGFHVKGGLDLNLPVFVSKVKDNSPASECQPPLEEGDQVLFVNGMPTDTATHIEVITAIKSSLDKHPPQLVLIIKPRDLSRVDPTIQDTLPHHSSDPHTLLRDAMIQLKENVLNGSILVHFDRLYRKKPGMLTIASKLPQNLSKNRYRDITAYDVTRVHLLDGPVDYINANYVNMEIPSTCQVIRHIVTQGPMQNTCIDYWQMIWEQGCGFIVMLTDVVEEGKVKCCRYWPDQGTSTEYGPFQIYCESDRKDNLCSTKHFVLRNNKTYEERPLVHLQFLDWTEQNVPLVKADFLRFIRRLHTLRHGMEDPLVVHCSGGIDRSGLFVAMETALTKIEIVEAFNPLEIIREMRDQRGMMCPALKQYKFFCECIVQAYEEDYIEIELTSRSNAIKASP